MFFLLTATTATVKSLCLDNNLAVYSVGKQSPCFFCGKFMGVKRNKNLHIELS